MQTELRNARAAGTRFADEMVGYEVRAETPVGRVERITYDGEWAVVTAGRLVRHRYAIPAWSIRLVDTRNRAILLGLSKEEIEQSPAYDDKAGLEDDYEAALEEYYGELLAGSPQSRAA
jgi:hypothetical protein